MIDVSMRDYIAKEIKESAETKQMCMSLINEIEKAAQVIIDCYKQGHKIVVFGNGGSAADSQHFVAEMINKYQIDRKPLPAISFTTNTSNLTSIGNDSSFDYVFEKQAIALCEPGDVAIAITTSDIEEKKHGHSADIYHGILAAKKKGAKVIGLFGERSIKASNLVDVSVMIPSKVTSRVQECHILTIHIICGLIEKNLF